MLLQGLCDFCVYVYAEVFGRRCLRNVLTCYDNLINELEHPVGEGNDLRLRQVDCEFLWKLVKLGLNEFCCVFKGRRGGKNGSIIGINCQEFGILFLKG